MAHITVHHFTDEERKHFKENYIPWQQGQEYIKTNPGNYVLPLAYEKYKDQIYNWKLGDGDMFLFGWMKTGTTWAREMVWCLMNGCDLEKAKESLLNKRIPFIDMAFLADFEDNISQELGASSGHFLTKLQNMPSPKILKSHLPFQLLNPQLLDQCKVVMCLRNPKDTLVSYYHHEKLIKLHGLTGDFATFFNFFIEDKLIFSPFFEYTVQAWERRSHPNMCILFYEDMKQDLAKEIKKVAEFLGKSVTDEQVGNLVAHLGFDKMKQNDTVNNEAIREVAFVSGSKGSFIRKGEVGDWKTHFTKEMNEKMDELIEKHFKNIGLNFRYE